MLRDDAYLLDILESSRAALGYMKGKGCVSNELKDGTSRRFSRRLLPFFKPSGRLFQLK
jgi:hypothetical protein